MKGGGKERRSRSPTRRTKPEVVANPRHTRPILSKETQDDSFLDLVTHSDEGKARPTNRRLSLPEVVVASSLTERDAKGVSRQRHVERALRTNHSSHSDDHSSSNSTSDAERRFKPNSQDRPQRSRSPRARSPKRPPFQKSSIPKDNDSPRGKSSNSNLTAAISVDFHKYERREKNHGRHHHSPGSNNRQQHPSKDCRSAKAHSRSHSPSPSAHHSEHRRRHQYSQCPSHSRSPSAPRKSRHHLHSHERSHSPSSGHHHHRSRDANDGAAAPTKSSGSRIHQPGGHRKETNSHSSDEASPQQPEKHKPRRPRSVSPVPHRNRTRSPRRRPPRRRSHSSHRNHHRQHDLRVGHRHCHQNPIRALRLASVEQALEETPAVDAAWTAFLMQGTPLEEDTTLLRGPPVRLLLDDSTQDDSSSSSGSSSHSSEGGASGLQKRTTKRTKIKQQLQKLAGKGGKFSKERSSPSR